MYPADRVRRNQLGCPEEDRARAARMLAHAAKPARSCSGALLSGHEHGRPCPPARRIAALFQITGNVDVPGGMVAPPSEYHAPYYRRLGRRRTSSDRAGARSASASTRYPCCRCGFKNASPDVTIEAVETGRTSCPYDDPLRASSFQTTNAHRLMARRPAPRVQRVQEVRLHRVGRPVHDPHHAWPWPTWCCRPPPSPSATASAWATAYSAARLINKAIAGGRMRSPTCIINLELGKRYHSPECLARGRPEEMFYHMRSRATDMHVGGAARGRSDLPSDFEYEKYEKGLLRADGQPGFQTATGPHRAVVLLLQRRSSIDVRAVASTSPPPAPIADA